MIKKYNEEKRSRSVVKIKKSKEKVIASIKREKSAEKPYPSNTQGEGTKFQTVPPVITEELKRKCTPIELEKQNKARDYREFAENIKNSTFLKKLTQTQSLQNLNKIKYLTARNKLNDFRICDEEGLERREFAKTVQDLLYSDRKQQLERTKHTPDISYFKEQKALKSRRKAEQQKGPEKKSRKSSKDVRTREDKAKERRMESETQRKGKERKNLHLPIIREQDAHIDNANEADTEFAAEKGVLPSLSYQTHTNTHTLTHNPQPSLLHKFPFPLSIHSLETMINSNTHYLHKFNQIHTLNHSLFMSFSNVSEFKSKCASFVNHLQSFYEQGHDEHPFLLKNYTPPRKKEEELLQSVRGKSEDANKRSEGKDNHYLNQLFNIFKNEKDNIANDFKSKNFFTYKVKSDGVRNPTSRREVTIISFLIKRFNF